LLKAFDRAFWFKYISLLNTDPIAAKRYVCHQCNWGDPRSMPTLNGFALGNADMNTPDNVLSFAESSGGTWLASKPSTNKNNNSK